MLIFLEAVWFSMPLRGQSIGVLRSVGFHGSQGDGRERLVRG